jgi:hypothetical protein
VEGIVGAEREGLGCRNDNRRDTLVELNPLCRSTGYGEKCEQEGKRCPRSGCTSPVSSHTTLSVGMGRKDHDF